MATLQVQFGNENQDVSQKPVVQPERKRRASIMITSKGFAQDSESNDDKAAKRRQRMSLGGNGNKRVSFGGEKIRLYQTDSAVLLNSPVAPLGARQSNGLRNSTEFVDARMDMVFENADAEAEAELQTVTATKSVASPSPRRARIAKSLSPAKSPAQNASPYSLRPRSPAQGNAPSTPQSVASPSASLANAFGNGTFSGNSPSMSVDISMDFSAAASGNNRIKFRPLAVPASPGGLFTPADTSDIESMIHAVPISPAAPVIDLAARRVSLNASESSDLTMDASLNGMELTRNFGSIVSAVQSQDASIDLPELKSLVDDDCTLPASALPSPASMVQVGKDAIRWSSSAFALSSPANSSMNMSTATDATEHESPASLQALLDDDHTLHAMAASHAAIEAQADQPASLGSLVEEDHTLHAHTEASPAGAVAPSLGALLEDDVTLAVPKQQVSTMSPFVDSALSLSTLVSEDVTIGVSTKPSNSRFSALDASTASDESVEQESSDVEENDEQGSEAESDQEVEEEDEVADEEAAEEDDDDSEAESPADLQSLVADDVTLPVSAAYRRISGNFGNMSPATAMQLGYATAAAAASPYAPYLMNMMAAAVASPATSHRLSGSFFASPAAQENPQEIQSPVPLPAAAELSQLVSEDMTLVAPANSKSLAACATPAGTLFANAFTPINAMTPSTSFSTPASTAAATPFDSPSKRLSTSLTAESPSSLDKSAENSTRHTVLLSRSAWEQQQQEMLMQQQQEETQRLDASRRQSIDMSTEAADQSMDTSSTEVASLQVDSAAGEAPIQWSHPSMQPSTPANADTVTHSVASAFRGVASSTPSGNNASASKSIAGRPSILNASIANGDATGDLRARLMKAEYAKILFGGNDDTTMGAFNVDNMSDQTRQLVAEHAHILAELAAAELAAAGNSASAQPASSLLPNMSASTLALLGVPSPAGRLATTPASRRLPTFSSSQRKQRASPATPSVSLTAAMLARRMSFNTAVNDHSLVAAGRTQFVESTEMNETDSSSNLQESIDVANDEPDSVAAFFRACDITTSRISVTRKSNANGFVQRDASVAPPKDAREELQRCVFEATELEINELASSRWQNVMEQLKTNIEEATQFFQQQPPPVMQMLALVPEEQRPAFGDCMRQVQQKCVAESRWQAAQRRVEDETEALNLWNQQLTSVRVDLAAANTVVSQLDRRCSEQRELHEQSVVLAVGLAAVRAARQELSTTADVIEASQLSIAECESQLAETQARTEIARVEAAEASNEVASLTEQHSYESRLRAAERAAAEAARLAKIEAVSNAAKEKQSLRNECTLLQSACSFIVLDEDSLSGDVEFPADMTPIVALSFGEDTYRITVLNHENSLKLHARVYQPHSTIEKSFAESLLATANLDSLIAPQCTDYSLKQQLPGLIRAVDTRLGRACDLLDEIVTLQVEHGINITFPTAERPTVQVSLMHKGDHNGSAASITAQLQQLLLEDSSIVAPRVEVEFEVSAQYPYAPLGRRLLRRVLHDETVALGDSQPDRLLNRMTDASQGFGRLTKVCLALRNRIPERY